MMANATISPPEQSVSPWLEFGSYEALWSRTGMSFKQIADLFRAQPGAFPSEFVTRGVAASFAHQATEILRKANITDFGVRVHGAWEYPEQLRAAEHPIEVLYYRGWWDLVSSPSVAVVGTRSPSEEAAVHTRIIAKSLVKDGYTVVSGLAKGVDTIAHETAIAEGGLTIGVLGTPLSVSYPATNKGLQEKIAREYLLISQVPIVRYSHQGPKVNRMFFPERNITMAALTRATVIVEAGETSGTLTQARAAIKQRRPLFILESCFRNAALTWPRRFEEAGAIRVRDYREIRERLGSATNQG
jgi:DNA processing protein